MLSKQQWCNIHNHLLGLRSEDNPDTIRNQGASYAMDMGRIYHFNEDAPANWEELLNGTITFMKSFPNSSTRYLLIVSKSTGNSRDESEYCGTFPKSSAKAEKIIASTPLNQEIDDLADWVKQQIQKIK